MAKVISKTPDIHEFVGNVELTGIRFLDISGRAKSDPDEDQTRSDVDISVQESHGPSYLQVRFRVAVENHQATYGVELALQYETEVEYEHDRAVLEDFIERVAIMSAFPYIREAVSTTAAKLELDVPILGILRQGEFKLGQAASE